MCLMRWLRLMKTRRRLELQSSTSVDLTQGLITSWQCMSSSSECSTLLFSHTHMLTWFYSQNTHIHMAHSFSICVYACLRLKDDTSISRIKAFESWCGGLPAIHCANNPLGYKFSWSPRGVLTAAKNGARYREDGKDVDIAPGMLSSARRDVDIGRLHLEGVPNRDSIKYESIYGLDGLDTVLRGTLRYPVFWDHIGDFVDAGMLNEDGIVSAETLGDYLNDLEDEALKVRMKKFPLCLESRVCPDDAPIDMLSSLLSREFVFKAGEQDMVVLRHRYFCFFVNVYVCVMEFVSFQREKKEFFSKCFYSIPFSRTF
eukprot:m.106295 g.106295  ORF g.106295 m.106295 type:complete len:315 (-) comp12671_c0_seq7:24-968(-)